ncbi:DUF1589 domain-containing protein [Rhodopirellula europaea]|uniref:DUF1589 domain-containing protein n=1 Tax=Rhodopirellula europaea TaxID=1263866 RepID=UPI001181A898
MPLPSLNSRRRPPCYRLRTRRPCLTWHPSRCFGTKRGVNQTNPREFDQVTARQHRQVGPGLR